VTALTVTVSGWEIQAHSAAYCCDIANTQVYFCGYAYQGYRSRLFGVPHRESNP